MKPLADVSFQDALTAWNEGFKGYEFDMTTTLDAFIRRFGHEDLSAEFSVVAMEGEKPVGIVLNALRTIGGKKVTWDGGTGVHPDYRGQGVGKMLVEACLKLFKEQDVHLATLEALSENAPAIGLYERSGYKIVDRLVLLSRKGTMDGALFGDAAAGRVVRRSPYELAKIPFYDALGPWQTQWESVAGGDAHVMEDGDGRSLGYALGRIQAGPDGAVTGITLSQCAVDPAVADPGPVIQSLLRAAFAPLEADCRRTAFNIRASSTSVVESLKSLGFEPFAEQVYMFCTLA